MPTCKPILSGDSLWQQIHANCHEVLVKYTPRALVWYALAGLLPPIFFIVRELMVTPPPCGARLWSVIAVSVVFSVLITIIASICVSMIVAVLQVVFPWNKYPVKRLVTELVWSGLVVSLLMCLYRWASLLIVPEMAVQEADSSGYFELVATGLIMNILIVSIYEGACFFAYWKESLIHVEKMEMENVRNQYLTLKNQINPHFLFNSLNVLSALVYQDQEKAERFIDEFANVYRYVLDAAEEPLVSLRQELAVVHSFLYLQSIRFGESLCVQDRLPSALPGGLVPPLAIQLLVENAIKHNACSKQHPLTIRLSMEKDRIIVENTFQPRPSKHSTGLGLKNLAARYKLLGAPAPRCMAEEGFYRAEISIIHENTVER